MNTIKSILALALILPVAGVSALASPQAAHACGRFDFVCKANKRKEEAERAFYRANFQYQSALVQVKFAKNQGWIRGNDCRDMVNTGSVAAGAYAGAQTANVYVGLVTRTIGKRAGNLMCSDAGM